MLDLSQKPAVVVGGGKVAARRIRWLLIAGACVTVVAERAQEAIRVLAAEGKVTYREKPFAPADLEGAWVVVAATDSPEVNRKVAESAGDRQLVNVVDQPDRGNFHVPTSLQQGWLTLAVSTGGASPILAGMIRDKLAEQFDEKWAEALEALDEERRAIKGSGLCEEEKRHQLKRLARKWFDSL